MEQPCPVGNKRRDISAVRSYVQGNGYAMYHARRYVELLALLRRYVGSDTAVLDIGPGTLTGLIRRDFGRPVDALGFCADESTPEGRSYRFDLNDAQHEERWRRDLPSYDLVVMAEVIEHLYTAPRLVLLFLRTLLKPGGVLIVQTPNAASLHKRVKLLFGRNPYEMIREDSSNPGHFREYTRSELFSVAKEAGFAVEGWHAHDYFDFRYMSHAKGLNRPTPRTRLFGSIMNATYRMMPGSLKPGQSIVLRGPADLEC